MSHYNAGQVLTAGNLNTIAHQGIQRIEEKVLGTNQTTVAFNNIPQQYQSLWMLMSAGTNASGVAVLTARFNGDTGSNYITHRFNHKADATTQNVYNASESYMQVGIAGSNRLTSQNSITMPGYSRTDRNKSLLSTFTNPAPIADASFLGFCGGEWQSTSAITDIDILETPGGGANDIIAGSVFVLYGLGDTST